MTISIRSFRIEFASSWNNGKGGEPHYYLLYVNGNTTPYVSQDLDKVLSYIKTYIIKIPLP